MAYWASPFPKDFVMQVSIVEDDPVIAKAVRTAVCEAGHQCTSSKATAVTTISMSP